MQVSLQGIITLVHEEAVVLRSYRDSAGVLTIGVGHTAAAGGLVPAYDTVLTVEGALQLLVSDLVKFEKHVSDAVRVPLAQYQFDALALFDFNTGAISSGTVDDHLNHGDPLGAMQVLLQYDKAGGKKLASLDSRRAREQLLFTTGRYPTVDTLLVYDRYPGPARGVPVASLDLGRVRPAPQEGVRGTPAGAASGTVAGSLEGVGVVTHSAPQGTPPGASSAEPAPQSLRDLWGTLLRWFQRDPGGGTSSPPGGTPDALTLVQQIGDRQMANFDALNAALADLRAKLDANAANVAKLQTELAVAQADQSSVDAATAAVQEAASKIPAAT